jgi:23S rRNA (uracil1939-C5)-methyltransferase
MVVTIEKVVYGGAGLARTEQGVVFVPKTAPGDVVEIEVAERRKDYSVGKLREVITPSSARKIPTCPNFDSVGCCHWDHINYPNQLEYKKQIIRESLTRLAKHSYDGDIPALSGPDHGYRMRANFHLQDGLLGFVREGTTTVVPIRECTALSPELNAFIPAANALRVPAATVDVISNGSEIAATFHFAQDDRHQPWERWRDALFGIPGVTALIFNTGARKLSYRKHEPQLDVRGIQYQLSSDSFFQANRFLLDDFVAEVLTQTGPSPMNVLELFSGSGFFSLPTAQISSQVIGIENNPAAVKLARQNAVRNHIGNIQFAASRVDAALAGADLNPGVVILNPPRTGAGSKVAGQVAALKARRIVYISCNPTSFAPEMRLFGQSGYHLNHLTLIDQFPNTYHVELVARFELE